MERRTAPSNRAAAAPARAAPRSAVARPAPRAAASPAAGNIRGAEGARRVAEEAELAKQRAEARKAQMNEPYRASVPVGETREFVICDEVIDFYRFEHNFKDHEGKWTRHSGCVKEYDDCPGCRVLAKEGTYCMYLTVIDLTPYTSRRGETVPFSRKLYVVKGPQQKKMLRMAEREGNLRGLIIACTRDGEKEPRTGNDIEIVERMSEEDMQTYVREWTDKENKVHVENCFEVYDYEQIFPPVTTDDLRKIFGGAPTPGSRAANREALGDGRRAASAARAPARQDRDNWEQPEGEEEAPYEEQPEAGAAPAPAPRRAVSARPTPAARAPARAATRAAPPPAEEPYEEPPEEDGDPEYVEEAPPPPPRRAAPSRAAPAARAPAPSARPAPSRAAPSRPAPRTAAAPEPVGDDGYEDPPAPARRVSFRRGPAE